MNDLRDLLKHELFDLRSAEQQIVKALPGMISKANNPQLKAALADHLEITHKHLPRLEQVLALFNEESEPTTEKKGLLARLFKRNHVCKGMQGLIEEGEKIMSEEMNPEVLDAAIIASAQKIEHYEICGYGTAKAFAVELNIPEAVRLLDQTLQEEYEADTLLTQMAVSRLNKKAELASAKKGVEPTTDTTSENNPAYEARNAIQERSITKEIEEPELAVDKPGKTTVKKSSTAKNKAPKGEAARSDSERKHGEVRRSVSNDSNSKKAKTSPARKSSEGRSSKATRGR